MNNSRESIDVAFLVCSSQWARHLEKAESTHKLEKHYKPSTQARLINISPSADRFVDKTRTTIKTGQSKEIDPECLVRGSNKATSKARVWSRRDYSVQVKEQTKRWRKQPTFESTLKHNISVACRSHSYSEQNCKCDSDVPRSSVHTPRPNNEDDY